ncbi:MAG TPA: ABC transporter permease [Chloroflexota bacterium]|jgi:NitT/TauT family transport system permease protein
MIKRTTVLKSGYPAAGAGGLVSVRPRRFLRYAGTSAPPLLVLVLVLALWQWVVKKPELPPPSAIVASLGTNRAVIWTAWQITVWQEALRGYLAGCILGILVGIVCSRFDWVRRGLVPYAVLSNSVPIIAISPILVFWFGYDWPSKAAIVLVITFFPMLLNTATGLTSYSPLARELLTSYAASSWTVFRRLQLPTALPMIFNGLKICSTLSVIGATVAEYFSSQGTGLGTEINDGAQVAQWDLVWACVLVASVTGILFYALLMILERLFTFWHVSYRAGP